MYTCISDIYVFLFLAYAIGSEAYNFAQQIGAFEVRYYNGNSTKVKVLTQVVQSTPVHWCPQPQTQPITVIGNFNWYNVFFFLFMKCVCIYK